MPTSPPEFSSLNVGPINFSARRPAIIVPVVATTIQASLDAIQDILQSPHANQIEVIEWRIDHVLDSSDLEALVAAIQNLTTELSSQRLLVTLRTSREGGEQELSDDAYLHIISSLAPALTGHLIDIEYARSTAAEAIYCAQANEVVVIGSYHDFKETPSAVQISAHLRAIVHAGADIAKVAVTPNSPEDVLVALSAGLQAAQKLRRPTMVISMGTLGAASRLSAGIFGSCATFATLGEASAPGQLPLATVAAARSAMV